MATRSPVPARPNLSLCERREFLITSISCAAFVVLGLPRAACPLHFLPLEAVSRTDSSSSSSLSPSAGRSLEERGDKCFGSERGSSPCN